ncbi:hypothetical protein D3C86_1586590 [compost metagenome]
MVSNFARATTFALIALATTVVHAQDRIPTRDLRNYTRDWTEEEIIDLWQQMDRICRDNISGEIIPACLNRTELGAILNRRGMCQSAMPATYNQWQWCIVR